MRYALAAQIEAWHGRDNALDTFTMEGVERVRLERVSRSCYLVALESEDGVVILQFRGMADKPCKAVILGDP